MTALTLPRIAAELDLASGVFYAAESTLPAQPDEHLVVWLPEPRFPAGAEAMYRWTQDDRHIGRRHVTLNATALAELLYITDLDPAALDDTEALVAIDRSLTEMHCDMLRCSARVSAGLSAHANCADPLWQSCRERAARLLAVSL